MPPMDLIAELTGQGRAMPGAHSPLVHAAT